MVELVVGELAVVVAVVVVVVVVVPVFRPGGSDMPGMLKRSVYIYLICLKMEEHFFVIQK